MVRRSNNSSYKDKYASIIALQELSSVALRDAEHEKNEIITAGNRAQASINTSLRTINTLLDIPRGVQWVADENGVTIVQSSTVVQQNQTLVADARNVEQGILLLGEIIRGYDRALEYLIQHVEELSDSIRNRAMIGNRNLTDIEEPLGLRGADGLPQYEAPPPTFEDVITPVTVTEPLPVASSSSSVVPLGSSASVFSAFGSVPRPHSVHTPLFVNTAI